MHLLLSIPDLPPSQLPSTKILPHETINKRRKSMGKILGTVIVCALALVFLSRIIRRLSPFQKSMIQVGASSGRTEAT
jgi:cell division septation protein DedD